MSWCIRDTNIAHYCYLQIKNQIFFCTILPFYVTQLSSVFCKVLDGKKDSFFFLKDGCKAGFACPFALSEVKNIALWGKNCYISQKKRKI
jgi:hypothetical protein